MGVTTSPVGGCVGHSSRAGTRRDELRPGAPSPTQENLLGSIIFKIHLTVLTKHFG